MASKAQQEVMRVRREQANDGEALHECTRSVGTEGQNESLTNNIPSEIAEVLDITQDDDVKIYGFLDGFWVEKDE
jgi:hypothetical protein